MSECLYLDGRVRPLRVGLYGVALQIERPDELPILAPLPRLRRIGCWGRVDWAGDALLACAAHSIPISFLSAGRGVACFLPALPPAKAFGALIEEASLRADWTERLENWTDSELRRSLLTALKNRPETQKAVSGLLARGDARLALRVGLRTLDSPGPVRRIWSCFQECLHGWTVERLREQSLFLGHFGFSSDKPNVPQRLALVVSPLLLSETLEQAAREARRRRPEGPAHGAGAGNLAHRCALAFDRAEPVLAKHFAGALRRFERLVRDSAEEVEA